MKSFLLSVAVATACGTLSVAQRLAETCTADSCRVDVGSCEQYKIASARGKQCATSNTVLTTDVTLSECVDLVVANGACSNVFMFSPGSYNTVSSCECHNSADPATTCVVVDAHNNDNERIYEVTTNTPFCACPSDASADDKLTHSGKRCERNITSNILFNNKINILNNVINSGEVKVEAASIAAAADLSNFINDVTLHHAAVELERGVDAEVSLNIFVYQDGFDSLNIDNFTNATQLESIQTEGIDDDYVHIVEDALVAALIKNGYSTTLQNFATQNEPTLTSGACTCPAVVDTLHDCSLPCVIITANFVVLEQREFFEWELALIILACVIFVCALAIALSFVVRKPVEIVLPNKKKSNEEPGVEMTSGAF